MFMIHQIEILVGAGLNYGMGKSDFLIEGGNSTGFSITNIELNETFRVINTGLTTKAITETPLIILPEMLPT